MCPNDNAAMQTLQRDGVEFDMCPNCRGVWLDRGELEKIIAMAREDATPQAQPWEHPARHSVEPRYERRYDDDDRRFDRHGYAHKKKRGFDLFDIFD
jgi:Zn-finger nucleic acid-binding protein